MRKVKPQNPYQWSLPNVKVPFLAPDVVTKVIPSPVEGWDAISPLAEMDPKRAPILQNWVPRPGYVEIRGGFIPYSGTPGFSSPVETLFVYNPPAGQQFYAASGSRIWNINNGGSPSIAASGFTNARWQYTNFTPPNGTTRLFACNGADQLLMFDGTNWTNPSITGLPFGGSTTQIINIAAQKQRLWFCLNNSTVVAFMPVGNITGAIAGTQDFGLLWDKGGFLLATADWTIDGGSGPQDYMAFISTMGQVTLYSGTDPTNASVWSLVGTFNLPPPIGRRCVTRVGSDVAIITQQGVLPLSQALPFDPSADRSVAITSRIQNAVAQAANNYSGNFGWETTLYPFQQLLIVNIPISTNQVMQQYVMNTLTGSWCNFTGWNANTFAVFNNNLYFGDANGMINKAYIGAADNTTAIAGDMQCAFNWLDEPGRTKRMTMIQPLLQVSAGITPSIAVDEDFTTSTALAPISTLGGTTLWDVAQWDVANWPVGSTVYNSFLSVDAIGHALAVRMRANVSANIPTTLATFDKAVFDSATFDQGLATALPILQVNAFNSITELGGAI